MIMQQIVRGDYLSRAHIGLDFFDASINRIAAWVIGTRNSQSASLKALLDPVDMLCDLEVSGNFSGRLALQEALQLMPHNAIWDCYCLQQDVPIGYCIMDELRSYEQLELAQRS